MTLAAFAIGVCQRKSCQIPITFHDLFSTDSVLD